MGKPVARALVLKDGTVVTRRSLAEYALKSESRQIASDTFGMGKAYDEVGLVQPLYSIEALAQLLELNTYHNRAVRTIAFDTVGLGHSLVRDDDAAEQAEQAAALAGLLERPHPRLSLAQVLSRALVDFGATGNGYIEVIRETAGDIESRVVGLAPIPAHTIRRHRDGIRYVQRRGQNRVWFKVAGEPAAVRFENGTVGESGGDDMATEVIHLLDYTSRSDFYGLPSVLPAIGALRLDSERQDYMLDFFENMAVPSYAVTVVGAEIDENLEQSIRDYFQNDLRENRHATLVLTISGEGATESQAKITFEKLSEGQEEASFRLLGLDTRDEILTAHGVPPYRVGVAKEGALGGNFAAESSEIYKTSVIAPRKQMVEDELNRHVVASFGLEGYRIVFEELDTRNFDRDSRIGDRLVARGIISRNEARELLGYDRDDDDPTMDEKKPQRTGVSVQGVDDSLKALHAVLVREVYRGRKDVESWE